MWEILWPAYLMFMEVKISMKHLLEVMYQFSSKHNSNLCSKFKLYQVQEELVLQTGELVKLQILETSWICKIDLGSMIQWIPFLIGFREALAIKLELDKEEETGTADSWSIGLKQDQMLLTHYSLDLISSHNHCRIRSPWLWYNSLLSNNLKYCIMML